MAKVLYLVRHAKSSWADMNMSDFDRPLNKRGFRNAPEMGKRLRKRQVYPDLLLSSPAQRARSTAEIIAAEIGMPGTSIIYDNRIYDASCFELVQIVQGIKERHASAMLFGHNPSMEELVNLLSNIRIERMPTCAVATFELDVSTWEEAGKHTGRLLDFDYPKKAG